MSQQKPNINAIEIEVHFQAQRSRGPGGQNVNRTNSSVQLRWSVLHSRLLTAEQRFLICEKLASWMNKEGELLIRSDVHRDFEMNRKAVLDRLEALLEKAFHRPKPRRPTKPTRGSVERKKTAKQQRSKIKQNRRGHWD